jgi:hypothetical protein
MFGEKIQEFKKRLVVPTLNLKSKPKPWMLRSNITMANWR